MISDKGKKGENRILQVNVDQIDYGGVYALVMAMYKELRKHSDIQFDFCAFEKFQNTEEIKKIEAMGGHVYYIGYEGNKALRQFVHFHRYRKFLKEHPYHTIHAHGDLAFKLFIYSFGAKLAHVPQIILHSHSSGVDGTHRKIKWLAHKIFRPLISYTATDYLACSEKAKEWMYTNKIQKKVIVIKNGIDTSRYAYNQELRNYLRKKYNLENKFVIGQIGGFKYVKNHAFSLKVMREYIKYDESAIMIFVGKGELEKDIRELTTQYDLNDRVVFWGGSDEVDKLLQMMDAIIMPSYFEGLPMVAIEAQASGLPIVLSDRITKEVKVTERVHFDSIADTDAWRDRLKQIKDENNWQDRNVGMVQLEKSVFDIKNVVEEIAELYKND